jgi:hypothetical protein
MDFAAENSMTGQEFFDRILLAEGLAHIAENIFHQLDGETLANFESVFESWQQFFINNGIFFCKFWKRQYLQKLAKPGTDAHRLIELNPKLFQFDQADQGTFHIIYFFQSRACKAPWVYIRPRTYPFFEDIYPILYHGQKSDIISYPISRQKLKKDIYPFQF